MLVILPKISIFLYNNTDVQIVSILSQFISINYYLHLLSLFSLSVNIILYYLNLV